MSIRVLLADDHVVLRTSTSSVNHRSLPVRLDLVGDVHETLSCERGFSNYWLGMNASPRQSIQTK